MSGSLEPLVSITILFDEAPWSEVANQLDISNSIGAGKPSDNGRSNKTTMQAPPTRLSGSVKPAIDAPAYENGKVVKGFRYTSRS